MSGSLLLIPTCTPGTSLALRHWHSLCWNLTQTTLPSTAIISGGRRTTCSRWAPRRACSASCAELQMRKRTVNQSIRNFRNIGAGRETAIYNLNLSNRNIWNTDSWSLSLSLSLSLLVSDVRYPVNIYVINDNSLRIKRIVLTSRRLVGNHIDRVVAKLLKLQSLDRCSFLPCSGHL